MPDIDRPDIEVDPNAAADLIRRRGLDLILACEAAGCRDLAEELAETMGSSWTAIAAWAREELARSAH